MTLAEQIRNNLSDRQSAAYSACFDAVLAVVERCELIEGSSERIGAAFARSFLEVIARELGIKP